MIQVASAASREYLPYCAAMLHSLLSRNPEAHVHFLHGTAVGDDDLGKLAGMVAALGGRFSSHLVRDDQISGLPGVDLSSIPPTIWYRTFLPEFLPDQERVLYLDCDTLVVGDLQPLWEHDLSGHYLGAVEGVPAPGDEGWSESLGVPDGAGYFNSGVLLMNLEAMRADGIMQELTAFGRAHGERLRWGDQDALNVVMGHRRLALHPRWNCQNTLFTGRERAVDTFTAADVDAATAQPAIVHFEGPGDCKPWHFLSNHPWAPEYRESLARTPWSDTPLQGRTWRNRVIAATMPPAWRAPLYARIEIYKHRLGLPSDLG